MILVDGQPRTAIDARDRGLHYGDGLFETIAVKDAEPLLWKAHYRRLAEGCRRLAIPVPPEETLLAEARSLCTPTPSVLKILVTRGSGGAGYRGDPDAPPTRILMTLPWPRHSPAWRHEGVEARLCSLRLGHNPLLAGIKHLNRLEQVLARSEWNDDSIAEGLLCDLEGKVIEGTRSNLFLVEGEGLRTPDLSRCGVAGVMRGEVLETAARLGLECRVEALTLDDLRGAEALFVTNSLIGLWPIRRIEGHTYRPNEVIRRLVSQLVAERACA